MPRSTTSGTLFPIALPCVFVHWMAHLSLYGGTVALPSHCVVPFCGLLDIVCRVTPGDPAQSGCCWQEQVLYGQQVPQTGLSSVLNFIDLARIQGRGCWWSPLGSGPLMNPERVHLQTALKPSCTNGNSNLLLLLSLGSSAFLKEKAN